MGPRPRAGLDALQLGPARLVDLTIAAVEVWRASAELEDLDRIPGVALLKRFRPSK